MAWAIVGLAAALGGGVAAQGPSGDGAAAADSLHRGVCLVAGGPVAAEDFAPLLRLGVGWIAQTPFGWQERPDRPGLVLATGRGVFWGERDAGLRATARLARSAGISTLLKPHVWLTSGDHWSGRIRMAKEADWQPWFAEYRRFILHYADLAEEMGAGMLSIGTELQGTTEREADWRRLIAEVRSHYSGPLTYGANWDGEFERIAFWDALDAIGIQAYFPLGAGAGDTLTAAALDSAWGGPVARLGALAARTGKPILLTEVGYRSTADAAAEPWRWRTGGAADPALQAALYEALFRAFWDEPWCLGIYLWKWYPGEERPAARRAGDFTPQGKPAAEVMGRWFIRGAERRTAP